MTNVASDSFPLPDWSSGALAERREPEEPVTAAMPGLERSLAVVGKDCFVGRALWAVATTLEGEADGTVGADREMVCFPVDMLLAAIRRGNDDHRAAIYPTGR